MFSAPVQQTTQSQEAPLDRPISQNNQDDGSYEQNNLPQQEDNFEQPDIPAPQEPIQQNIQQQEAPVQEQIQDSEFNLKIWFFFLLKKTCFSCM